MLKLGQTVGTWGIRELQTSISFSAHTYLPSLLVISAIVEGAEMLVIVSFCKFPSLY